jgi:hypothetical protein
MTGGFLWVPSRKASEISVIFRSIKIRNYYEICSVKIAFPQGRCDNNQPEVVVSHERKQIPPGRDETECPATAGREPNRKLAFDLFEFTQDIVANAK